MKYTEITEDDYWAWENFKPKEIACPCCGELPELNDFFYESMDSLQRTRDVWGKPLRISSAYRCPKHNKEVGGAKGSYHMKKIAFDIEVLDQYHKEFCEIALECGFNVARPYKGRNFVHCDCGPKRNW